MYKMTMCFIFGLLVIMLNNPLVTAEQILSDPTRPSEYAVKIDKRDYNRNIEQFVVSKIYISAYKRMAIINGQSVIPGERIGHAQIVAIQPYSVKMLMDGKITTIGIIPSIKQYKK